MNKKYLEKRGFMKIVFLIIIAVIALAYFNVDVRGIINNILSNAGAQKVFSLIGGAVNYYIIPLGIYLWDGLKSIFP